MLFGKTYIHSRDQQEETVAIAAAGKKKNQVLPYKFLFLITLIISQDNPIFKKLLQKECIT